MQVTAGKEEGRKTLRAPLFFQVSSGGALEHAPPVTVARWNTRRHCSSTVAAIPEVVPLQFLEFRDCFVNFGLCNVIFVECLIFYNFVMWM